MKFCWVRWTNLS